MEESELQTLRHRIALVWLGVLFLTVLVVVVCIVLAAAWMIEPNTALYVSGIFVFLYVMVMLGSSFYLFHQLHKHRSHVCSSAAEECKSAERDEPHAH